MTTARQALIEYEKQMKNIHQEHVNGKIWNFEVSEKKGQIVQSLRPTERVERSKFLKKLSSIDKKLKEETNSRILKLTLPKNEIERMEKIYKEHMNLRENLGKIVEETNITTNIPIKDAIFLRYTFIEFIKVNPNNCINCIPHCTR